MGQELTPTNGKRPPTRVRILGRKSSPANLRKFLDTLTDIPTFVEASKCAGFSTSSFKVYMEKSEAGEPGFVIQWRDMEGPFHELVVIAAEEGLQSIKSEIFRRAKGYDEPLVDRGRVQYQYDPDLLRLGFTGVDAYKLDAAGNPIPETVRKQSEELLMFIAERKMPEFMLKQQIDVNKTTHVMVVGATKPPAELDKLEQAALKAPVLDVEFDEVEPE